MPMLFEINENTAQIFQSDKLCNKLFGFPVAFGGDKEHQQPGDTEIQTGISSKWEDTEKKPAKLQKKRHVTNNVNAQ